MSGSDDFDLPPLPDWLLVKVSAPDRPPRSPQPIHSSIGGNGGTPYGRAALEGECEELACAPEGQRNNRLNEAAFAAGQLLAGGELTDQDVIKGSLADAAIAAGLPEAEAARTIRSGLEAGTMQPRRAPPRLLGSHDRGQSPASASEAGSDPVEYLDLVQIRAHGIPPVPWVIEGWVAERDIAIIAGGAGSGKTTTIGDLAVALASGRPWCGIVPSRPCRVLFFDEEQGEATTARLFLRLGAPVGNLKVASGQGIRIDTADGLARLEGEIATHRPDVVVLDSVQQVFGAISEKDNTLIGLAYRDLFRLRDTYGVTFILVHHKRKSNADHVVEAIELVRGGTAHGTQASTVWSASGDGATHMDLVQAKRRGSSKQSLRIAYHEDGPDGLITLTGEGPVESRDTLLARVSEWVVELLADKTEMKRAAIVEAGRFAEHSEDSIDEALKHLVGIGRLVKPEGRRGWYALKESAP